MSVTGTITPHSPETETAILAACLQDDGAATIAAERLRPSDFFDDHRREIFSTVQSIKARGEAVNLNSVYRELQARGGAAKEITATSLHDLWAGPPAAAYVEQSCRFLREDAARRQLLEACKRTAEKIRADGADFPALLRAMRDKLTDLEGHTGRKDGLALTPIGELLGQEEEVSDWLVEDRLPFGGTSIAAGKPKAGKSTLVRCLTVAVAKGQRWLGFNVHQGTAIYLGLEEKRAEVRAHYRRLGVMPDDPLLVFLAPSPEDGLARLRQSANELHPALIVVDPLLKMIRVRDANDYAVVSRALEPFIALARETGAHLMAVHHLGKGERSGGDAILGSTAIFAAVDTALLLKRGERYRTLSSIQRYGPDLEEITLSMDGETGLVMDGPARREVDETQAGEAILEYLRGKGEPVEERDIQEGVEGRKAVKVGALRSLVVAGKVTKAGAGKRGSPFVYSVSGSLVPNICREPAKPEMKNDETPQEQTANSGSGQNGIFESLGTSFGTRIDTQGKNPSDPPGDEDQGPVPIEDSTDYSNDNEAIWARGGIPFEPDPKAANNEVESWRP